jgi:hypothetical protein
MTKVNTNTQLILEWFCLKNCNRNYVKTFNAYTFSNMTTPPKWLLVYSANINDRLANEITLKTDFFSQYTSLSFSFKFEINFSSISSYSLFTLVNQVPTNGICSISSQSNENTNNLFKITCVNWYDPDGVIQAYNFYAWYLGDKLKLALGSSLNGTLGNIEMPQGALYDENRVYITIEIVDNDHGIASFNITSPLTISTITNQTYLSQLYNGNTLNSMQTLLSTSSILNKKSVESRIRLEKNYSSNLPLAFGPLNDFILAQTKAQNETISSREYDDERNVNSHLRDTLVSFINNISISGMASIRSQASMLAVLTQQTNEISRSSAQTIMNQCIRLILAMKSFSSYMSIDEIKEVSQGLLATLGNINTAMSLTLNQRQTLHLSSDLESSLTNVNDQSVVYETDLENFWSQPKNFRTENANTLMQKFACVDMSGKSENVLDLLTFMLLEHTPLNETNCIETQSLSMCLTKVIANRNGSTLVQALNGGQFKLPPLGELLRENEQIIGIRSVSMPMATSGFNGNNETFIGFSSALDLSLFDSNQVALGLVKPLEIWIPRDRRSLIVNYSFQYVNVTNLVENNDFILVNSFQIMATNASIQIHLKSLNSNSSVGYLILLKFGVVPILNVTYADYDHMKILCSDSGKN